MKLTIESTENFFMLEDVMVRAWVATEDDIILLVAAVAVPSHPGESPLATLGNLIEIPPPDEATQRAWAERIMGGLCDAKG